MLPKEESPYDHCPSYETGRFVFRMVQPEDAQDLLECYSDPISAMYFNSDNCTNDFVYHTVDEMKTCIRFWLDEYARRMYVRFTILDKARSKGIGTLEFFARDGSVPDFGRVGMLRLDLASKYETQDNITEIIGLVEEHFYTLFGVDSIITKAVSDASQRIAALKWAGYQSLPSHTIVPYGNYYGIIKK